MQLNLINQQLWARSCDQIKLKFTQRYSWMQLDISEDTIWCSDGTIAWQIRKTESKKSKQWSIPAWKYEFSLPHLIKRKRKEDSTCIKSNLLQMVNLISLSPPPTAIIPCNLFHETVYNGHFVFTHTLVTLFHLLFDIATFSSCLIQI